MNYPTKKIIQRVRGYFWDEGFCQNTVWDSGDDNRRRDLTATREDRFAKIEHEFGIKIIFGIARTDALEAGFLCKRRGNSGQGSPFQLAADANNSVLKLFKTLTVSVFYQVKKSSCFALE